MKKRWVSLQKLEGIQWARLGITERKRVVYVNDSCSLPFRDGFLSFICCSISGQVSEIKLFTDGHLFPDCSRALEMFWTLSWKPRYWELGFEHIKRYTTILQTWCPKWECAFDLSLFKPVFQDVPHLSGHFESKLYYGFGR